jgi:type II secretory pathway pseudopilin PulG
VTARDRLIVSIVVALVAVVAAWLLVIQPKRDEASRLGGQIQAAQQQLQSAEQQAAVARADEHAYAENYASVARLGEAVPGDDEVPSLIYQLQAAASATGVDFRSLVLNAGSSGSPASSSSTGTATAGTATGSLPPGATVGPAGFPVMPFTFTFTGNFFHLADFFGRLEQFVVATERRIAVHGRLMTINAISFGPGASGFPQILATVSATTYLLPASQGLTGGATAGGPAAGAPVSAGTSATAGVPSGSAGASTPTAAVTP